jgi:hypothetical protein
VPGDQERTDVGRCAPQIFPRAGGGRSFELAEIEPWRTHTSAGFEWFGPKAPQAASWPARAAIEQKTILYSSRKHSEKPVHITASVRIEHILVPSDFLARSRTFGRRRMVRIQPRRGSR